MSPLDGFWSLRTICDPSLEASRVDIASDVGTRINWNWSFLQFPFGIAVLVLDNWNTWEVFRSSALFVIFEDSLGIGWESIFDEYLRLFTYLWIDQSLDLRLTHEIASNDFTNLDIFSVVHYYQIIRFPQKIYIFRDSMEREKSFFSVTWFLFFLFTCTIPVLNFHRNIVIFLKKKPLKFIWSLSKFFINNFMRVMITMKLEDLFCPLKLFYRLSFSLRHIMEFKIWSSFNKILF